MSKQKEMNGRLEQWQRDLCRPLIDAKWLVLDSDDLEVYQRRIDKLTGRLAGSKIHTLEDITEGTELEYTPVDCIDDCKALQQGIRNLESNGVSEEEKAISLSEVEHAVSHLGDLVNHFCNGKEEDIPGIRYAGNAAHGGIISPEKAKTKAKHQKQRQKQQRKKKQEEGGVAEGFIPC